MKKQKIILLSTLLVGALNGFAQSNNTVANNSASQSGATSQSTTNKTDAERADSLWKDVDLNAVTVVASKPLVKMEADRMTYNVQEDAEAKASTVLDMLRKVPMVTVDGQDNITVNGSSNFKVYVDGKPNPMFTSSPSQIFKAMPATMVKNIEVITNPGAKYDAEGTGGVLNIVLNKQGTSGTGGTNLTNGYNGSMSLSYGSTTQQASALVSGQQGKFTYSAHGLYNYSKRDGTEINLDQIYTDGSQMHYYQKSKMKQPFGMGDISLGYEIDSLSNIGFNAGLTTFGQKMNGNPHTQMAGGIYGKGFEYSNDMRQKVGSTSFNGSIDYQRFFNKQRSSYMILSYLFSTNPTKNDEYRYYDNKNGVTGITLDDLFSKNRARGTEHTFQADFTESLSQTQKLNFGGKFIARSNKSDSKYYDIDTEKNEILNPDNSVEYKNQQSILAAYAEWNGKFGSLGTKLGTRYEHTWEKVTFKQGNGEDFQKNYGTLVPNATLSYSLGAGMNIGVNYNLRIVRPGISYLNPYVDRSNPTTLKYGNTDLEVEKSHHINMVYNYYNAKFMLSTTLGYTFCNNGISQYSFLDADDLLNTTYGNVTKQKTTSLNVFANWLIFKKTRLMLNGSVSYSDLSSDQLGQKNSGWSTNSMINLQQTLPADIEWTIGSILSSKTYNLQGYHGGTSFIYTTLSKALVKDKLILNLMYLTPLGDKLEINQKAVGSNYVQTMSAKVALREIRLSVVWRFGNTKKQFKQIKSNISNDFQEKKEGMQVGGAGGQ